VSEEDHLPKIMCGECSYKLDMFSDFKNNALKTELELFSKVDFVNVNSEVCKNNLNCALCLQQFTYLLVLIGNMLNAYCVSFNL
jgi:hypothetical protein